MSDSEKLLLEKFPLALLVIGLVVMVLGLLPGFSWGEFKFAGTTS
jgi:hypothetical protein